ncbi:hypothetical protein EYF80_024322 [Liparis tanakae]|uniref:Uncharacterized protein n=1 Tax=Liparis tanakae TaxID=230148 RepID=A0A4Z2HKK8_9TELE|nr:hypothetical protein EYF80_024322 [Liparis tanakae]
MCRERASKQGEEWSEGEAIYLANLLLHHHHLHHHLHHPSGAVKLKELSVESGGEERSDAMRQGQAEENRQFLEALKNPSALWPTPAPRDPSARRPTPVTRWRRGPLAPGTQIGWWAAVSNLASAAGWLLISQLL